MSTGNVRAAAQSCLAYIFASDVPLALSFFLYIGTARPPPRGTARVSALVDVQGGKPGQCNNPVLALANCTFRHPRPAPAPPRPGHPHASATCRAERRLEDVAARSHFEIQVHGDRLVNPSSANPGMAAGRATGRADRRRAGTRLRCPPLRLELPVELAGASEAGDGAASHHMGTVLVMPMQNAVSEDMRAWAARSGALARDRWLPALLKPYLRLPLDRMTVRVRRGSLLRTLGYTSGALKRVTGGIISNRRFNKRGEDNLLLCAQDLKTILARLLNMHEFWHDSLHAYERAEGIEAHQLALHLEWSQARPQTPNWLLTEEVPDDADVQPFLQEGQGACSLLAFSLFLERHGVLIEQGLDLIYSVRPHVA